MSLAGKISETLRWLRYGPTELRRVREQQQQLTGKVDELAASLDGLHRGLDHLTHSVMAKAADVDLQFVRNSLAAQIQREAGWLRDQVSALSGALDKVQAGSTGGASPASSPATAAAEEAFYPALEQQFRGTRDEIRARLMAYQPWMQGLPAAPVADIGCGRGEWLELLHEWNLDAVGIDLNALLVQESASKGLRAVHADALAWLAEQPANSLSAITSFHVVEHLPFGLLLKLVDQARRVLQPGGRLILETPNPENLQVATQSFWLDPTHQRPLPPVLLEFLVSHAGLQLETTLRLNPPEGDGTGIADPVLRGLLMQGRDYGVIARKPAA